MNEEYFTLMADLHGRQDRQGPGGAMQTARAMDLAGLPAMGRLKIADIGCGTGASALQLAAALDAEIVAIDFMTEFVDSLAAAAEAAEFRGRIEPRACSMEDLPFAAGELDAIWSEGAIYNVGFERGVKEWRRYLRPGGILAVTEITWLTASRPGEIENYWNSQYPEIALASRKLELLERHGYSPVGYFPLPDNCWTENYYQPLKDALPDFLARHPDDEAAEKIAVAEQEEMALYERFGEYYGYGFYIARKVD